MPTTMHDHGAKCTIYDNEISVISKNATKMNLRQKPQHLMSIVLTTCQD
jgi:hypothetical protein